MCWPSQSLSSEPVRESRSRIDDARHAVSLREIPPLFTGSGIYVLREQSMLVPAREHSIEHGTGFVALANRLERIYVPEGADEERVFRSAEVVGFHVTVDEI